jgi:hypothetical protein
VIAEATILARFVLSLELVTGCINIASILEKNGQEPHHAVPTLSAALPIARHALFAVIFMIETVNRMPLIFKAVPHKDLGGEKVNVLQNQSECSGPNNIVLFAETEPRVSIAHREAVCSIAMG